MLGSQVHKIRIDMKSGSNGVPGKADPKWELRAGFEFPAHVRTGYAKKPDLNVFSVDCK
jgi:hypothetical protein